jgi:hypothetical protein
VTAARIVVTGVLLGILAAVVSLAVLSALEDHRELSLGVPGEVTVLDFQRGSDSAGSAEAVPQLVEFLRDNGLVLVGSSVGDGHPAITVLDPTGLLPWFPSDGQEWGVGQGSTYVLAGSYSAAQWRMSGHPSLLREGATVAGEVALLEDVGHIQFAWNPGASGIEAGRYVTNSVDPVIVDMLRGTVEAAGLRVYRAQALPLLVYLRGQPFLMVSLTLLLGGVAAAGIHLSMRILAARQTVTIRVAHGATAYLLLLRSIPALMIYLGLGMSIGAASLDLGVWLAGARSSGHAELAALGAGCLIGLALVGVCLTGVVALTLRWMTGRAVNAS